MGEIEPMKKVGLILGKVGSGLGLVSPIFLLVLWIRVCEGGASIAFGTRAFLGGFSLMTPLSHAEFALSVRLVILIVSQLFFILLGILGIVYDRKNSKIAGILLIVAGVGFAFASGLSYWAATPLLLAAGFLLLLQSRKEITK
jgi:hypothetical protein